MGTLSLDQFIAAGILSLAVSLSSCASSNESTSARTPGEPEVELSCDFLTDEEAEAIKADIDAQVESDPDVQAWREWWTTYQTRSFTNGVTRDAVYEWNGSAWYWVAASYQTTLRFEDGSRLVKTNSERKLIFPDARAAVFRYTELDSYDYKTIFQLGAWEYEYGECGEQCYWFDHQTAPFGTRRIHSPGQYGSTSNTMDVALDDPSFTYASSMSSSPITSQTPANVTLSYNGAFHTYSGPWANCRSLNGKVWSLFPEVDALFRQFKRDAKTGALLP